MFTIGYATKAIDDYIAHLHQYQVTVVADIRSVPYSRTFHDYNRETMQQLLKAADIRYVYLGLELGPRSKDPAHYNRDKQVQFDRIMASDPFKSGIDRLRDGLAKGYCIALNCAEKDPAICHRSLLVGWSLLHQYDIESRHIRHDGGLETQTQLEARLLQITDTEPDMLMDEQEALRLAYQRQCQACAYRIPEY